MTDRETDDAEFEEEIDAFVLELAESMFGPIDRTAPVYEGPPRWHSFDLDGQAVDALRHVSVLIPQAIEAPYMWKWVVIAMFDAMHGFFGLALRRSDGAQLLTERHEQRTYDRWYKERQLGQPLPQWDIDRIDDTRNLYAKTLDPDRMRYLGGGPFTPTTSEDAAFERLVHLRDKLTHHGHGSLSIFVGELPLTILGCLPIIEWLFEKAGTFRPRKEEQAHIREAIRSVRKEAVAAAAAYKLEGNS